MKTKIFSKVVNGNYIKYVQFPPAVISSVPVHREYLEKFPRLRAARKACAQYQGWH